MRSVCKRIGINGEGIFFDQKIPVFVEGALPSEEAEIEIDEDFGKYKKGHIVKLYRTSKNRVKISCPYFEKCGACSLMHMNYEHQLHTKSFFVKEALKKYAGIEVELEVLENPNQNHYRNACKLPFGERNGKLYTGMYASGSNRFLPIESCMIHEEEIERVRKEVLRICNKYHLHAFDRKNGRGLRGLFIRHLDENSEICIIKGKEDLPKALLEELMSLPDVTVVDQSTHIDFRSIDFFGKDVEHISAKEKMEANFGGLDIEVSTRSFFQLNTSQALRLYELAGSFIDGRYKKVVEAYSGIGLISMILKDRAQEFIGIESIQEAVEDAKRIAERNGIDNCRFICGDAGKILSKGSTIKDADLLIVDPPRSGLDKKMIDSILKSGIKDLLYISCNPVTLAKNIADLGFGIKKIKAVDLFSNTAHVETVALLTRNK